MKVCRQLMLLFALVVLIAGCKKEYKTEFTEIYFGNIGGHFVGHHTYRLEDDGDLYRNNADGSVDKIKDLDKDEQKEVEDMVNDLEPSSLDYYHPTHPVDGVDNFMEIMIDGVTHRIYWSAGGDAPYDAEALYERLTELAQ